MGDTFSLDPEPARLADVAGFRTGAAACGLKADGPDIGILFCDNPDGTGAAVFTENAVRAAPVRVSSPRAATGLVRAVIVNAGVANCGTGEDGERDAREMISLAASGLDVPQERVLVASSGVVGRALPMEQVRRGIEGACREAREGGGGDFAGAIAAADVARSVASASGMIDGKAFRIAGLAKGASTAEPDMATMYAFLVTDVAVSAECLREFVSSASERTFSHLVVDAGTGTNDTLCVLASARAGNEVIDNVFSAGVFTEALEAVARQLLTVHIEVRISGAASERDARLVSRVVAGSILVRTAIQGGNPDWGLILAAAGRSAARVEDSRATVRLAGDAVYERGRPVDPVPEGLKEKLRASGGPVELDLGLGSSSATVWAQPLPGGNQERLEIAERAAEEAETQVKEIEDRLREVEGRRDAVEAERDSVREKLEEEASARQAASHEAKRLTERLEAAERGAEEAGARAEADRKALEDKLEETDSAQAAAAQEADKLRGELKRAAEEAEARLEAAREELQAKLGEAEAACEAASAETKNLGERLETAEKATKEVDAASAAEREALAVKIKENEAAQATVGREAEELRGELKKTGDKARATIVAHRKEFEAKLKEMEAAREAASGETKELDGRLGAAERAAEEARTGAAAERKALGERLKKAESACSAAAKQTEDLRSRLQRSAEEAEAQAEAQRKELEAKLKKAESVCAAALRESEDLGGRLEAAEETRAQALAAAEAGKTKRKGLIAKLTGAPSTTAEVEALKADLSRKDAELAQQTERAEASLVEAKRYWEAAKETGPRLEAAVKEAEKIKAQFSLKEQLIKQFMDEEKERGALVEKLEKEVEELRSGGQEARAKKGKGKKKGKGGP